MMGLFVFFCKVNRAWARTTEKITMFLMLFCLLFTMHHVSFFFSPFCVFFLFCCWYCCCYSFVFLRLCIFFPVSFFRFVHFSFLFGYLVSLRGMRVRIPVNMPCDCYMLWYRYNRQWTFCQKDKGFSPMRVCVHAKKTWVMISLSFMEGHCT